MRAPADIQAHIPVLFDDTDPEQRYAAFLALMDASNVPVAWADSVWDQLVVRCGHDSNHVRAMSTQLLCNLAKSDHEGRIVTALDTLFAVTYDPKFVTARHTIQALWKIGVPTSDQRNVLLVRLRDRFRNAEAERNTTLVRYDIIVGLRNLYDATGDQTVITEAGALVELEPDPKYRKKYLSALRPGKPIERARNLCSVVVADEQLCL
jgi:hypothetical protein